MCQPADPYLGGLLVSSLGAFFNRQEVDDVADHYTDKFGTRHWVVTLPTYADLPPPDQLYAGWEQLEFPDELMRHRGQSDWGVDLALETAQRWSNA